MSKRWTTDSLFSLVTPRVSVLIFTTREGSIITCRAYKNFWPNQLSWQHKHILRFCLTRALAETHSLSIRHQCKNRGTCALVTLNTWRSFFTSPLHSNGNSIVTYKADKGISRMSSIFLQVFHGACYGLDVVCSLLTFINQMRGSG